MSNDAVPAGWYPDPSGEQFMRWWDGGSWTTLTREGDDNSPKGAEEEEEQAQGDVDPVGDPAESMWEDAFRRYAEESSFPDPEDRRPDWVKKRVEEVRRRRPEG